MFDIFTNFLEFIEPIVEIFTKPKKTKGDKLILLTVYLTPIVLLMLYILIFN